MYRIDILFLICLSASLCFTNQCQAQVVIQGNVNALDGEKLTFDKLNELLRERGIAPLVNDSEFDIFVQGSPRNRRTVVGTFSATTGAYEIRLAATDIDPDNRIIDVRLSSIGLPVQLDTASLIGVSIVDQKIDVTMPISKPKTHVCTCKCRKFRRCLRLCR
ncbi:hypothetical protein [Lacipirellula sp.]|uniref:hypothetical protein n=1 Tax=Lacipirellula sp. TaxID=2691419 RepID=UPI003D0B43D1